MVSCYTYNMVLFWNGVDGFKYALAANPYLSVESFGLVIHKSPVVAEECYRLYTDFEYVDRILTSFSDIRNLSIWTHLLENIMYNFGDILQNIMKG